MQLFIQLLIFYSHFVVDGIGSKSVIELWCFRFGLDWFGLVWLGLLIKCKISWNCCCCWPSFSLL